MTRQGFRWAQWMGSLLFGWLLLSMVSPLLAGGSAQSVTRSTSHQATEHLSRLLKSFQTYQASFSQVTTVAAGATKGEVVQRNHGKVMIKRPGLFRWEANSPHQTIITDGKTLWIYDVDLEQATKQSLSKQVSVNPVALLSGSISDLTKNFSIQDLSTQNRLTFRLSPIQSDHHFQSIELSFSQARRVLLSMRVLNNVDQLTVFTFENVEVDRPLSDALFHFTAPDGVDVLAQ